MLATRRLYIFLLWTPMVATFEIPVDVTSSLGGDTAMASVWRNFAQSGLLLDLPPLGNNRRFICIRSLLVSLGGGRLPNVVRVNVVLGSYRVAFRRLRGGVESRL